jgi:hypothetical protein
MTTRSTSYCAGLPLERERPLSADELARVTALRRAWGRRTLARLAFVPVAFFVGGAIASGAHGASGEDAPLIAAAAFVIFGVLAPFAALVHAGAAAASWLRLGRDVRERRALRFAAGERSVSVLLRSGFVLEWDGAPAAAERRLGVGEAAEVPASAPTYAVDLGTAGTAPGLAIVRRPLSPAERDEVLAHAGRLARVPLVLGVFTGAFVLLAARVLETRRSGSAVGLVVVWAALLAYAWWRLVRARVLSRKLRADASNGWALRATEGEAAGDEVLAVSGATWTVQGAPAAWRVSRRGGR